VIRRARHLRRRSSRRGDGGFSLVELAVTLGLLAVAGTMAMTMLLTINRVSTEVGGRSDASTVLRRTLDDVFEQLATARGQVRCTDPASATSLATCRAGRVTEIGTPITEASTTRVCFLSRRPAPTTGAPTLTTTPWKLCLDHDSATGVLTLQRYQPTGELNPTYPAVTGIQTLGRSPVGSPAPFSYIGVSGAALTPPIAVEAIALVRFSATLEFRDRSGRLVERTLSMQTGLRAVRYASEGFWTGDKELAP
jgi:hypothetical protein